MCSSTRLRTGRVARCPYAAPGLRPGGLGSLLGSPLENGAALDVVGEGEPGFNLAGGSEAVVAIEPQAEVARPRAGGDGVLPVGGELLDVGVALEGVEAAAMGEIVGIEGGARRSGLGNSRVGNSGEAAKIGNQRRVDNAKLEVLVEERLLVGEAGLHIVNAAGVSDVGAEAGVGERTLLGDGLLL